MNKRPVLLPRKGQCQPECLYIKTEIIFPGLSSQSKVNVYLNHDTSFHQFNSKQYKQNSTLKMKTIRFLFLF